MTDWFVTSKGRDLVKQEVSRCSSLVPSGYYPNSLQVGLAEGDYLADIVASSRFLVDTRTPDEIQPDRKADEDRSVLTVYSASEALPFPEKSMDLVALPHTLDFCDDPHEVLRQVSQILVPEGCVAITGFNSTSFYGAIRMFKRGRGQFPWNGNYYTVRRVQDWLSLLGFDLVGAGMISYIPPLKSQKWRDRLDFVEKAGDRWWPGLGGIYVIVGRKRVMATNMLHQSRPAWQRLIPGIAQPAAQRAAKVRLRLVPKV